VTQNESQASVGGLLALNQVLRILGHVLPILGLQQTMEGATQVEVEIIGSRPLV
jgi:hypothetical protein